VFPDFKKISLPNLFPVTLKNMTIILGQWHNEVVHHNICLVTWKNRQSRGNGIDENKIIHQVGEENKE